MFGCYHAAPTLPLLAGANLLPAKIPDRSKMLPSVMPMPLSSVPSKTNWPFACINPFGLRMVTILYPESNQFTPAGKFNSAAVSLGHMAKLAMDRLRQWLKLWYSCSTMLIRTVLVDTAKRVVSLLQMWKAKREEPGRNQNKLKMITGSLRCLTLNHLEVYSQPTIEDLVEEMNFGEGPGQHLISEIDKMHLQEEGISEACFVSRCISLDSESDWEGSSEDPGLQGMKKMGIFSQKCLENCYSPQILTKSSDISQYVEETLKNCWSYDGELKDFEGFFSLDLERPLVSQNCKDNLVSGTDLAVCDKRSFKSLFDPSEAEEQIVAYGKSDSEGILNSEMSSYDFKSSLVHSLFYCPSEDEEDDSEDWLSEDELEENNQSGINFSSDSESGENNFLLEEDSCHQHILENLPDSFLQKNDPYHPLYFSKNLQAQKAHTSAQNKPQSCKDITVSFYLTGTDFKSKELSGPPKQLWPQKNPKAPSRHPIHKCCHLNTSKYSDPVATEATDIQEEKQVIKKVRFSPVVTVHPLVVWDYATRAARRGPWEEMARDRCRFHRRIGEVGAVLEPCLEAEHRAKIWRKIHGLCDCSGEEDNKTVSTSVGLEKLCLQNQE